MAEPVLRIEGLVKRFGGLLATNELSLDVGPGEIHALIGPNGAGKSTAIAQIAGELPSDSGRILFEGRDLAGLSGAARARLGLGRTFQVPRLLEDDTALDNVALAIQARQGHSFRFWADARRDAGLRGPAMAALERAALADRAETRVADLSHGEHKQLELAVALALGPRMLLLDEPMAGLGATESRQMTAILQGLKGQVAMLLVEHDMDAVFALADRVTVLVYGRAIATGLPEEIRADPEVRAAYLTEGDA
ncbi:ABC transporter ATP-binding protein [Arenibaculum pallidiluteum]|uniref:ABC transporter ATP-binding protein n=1 Tax=Arenibaculum pallidiluteum TaxID=2812559 RepID=UPI001A975560|nr:ABC transporter ATP-binding protein [Arenibaculum pallidiluteum]